MTEEELINELSYARTQALIRMTREEFFSEARPINVKIDSDGNVESVSIKNTKFTIDTKESDLSYHSSRYMINELLDNYYAAQSHLSMVIRIMMENIKRRHCVSS